MDSAKKLFILFLIILLSVEIVTLKPYITGPNVQNYKGDEVWYVDVARNYLHSVGDDVFYTHVVEYTQGGHLIRVVNYGANVLLRVPDVNSSFYQDIPKRVIEGDPNDVIQLLPQIYNYDNPAYAKYENQLFGMAGASGVTRVEGIHQKALNIAYYLFPSKQQIIALQRAAETYTAPENITVTVQYQVPVNNNGKITYVTKTLKYVAYTKGQKMFDVVPGFFYADQFGIEKYKNLEHPFLVKMILIGDMKLFGDNPSDWRIPSLISFLLIIILVALTVKEFTGSYFWGFVAALLAGVDPGLRMLGATAMLDIFVTLFSALAMYSLAKKKLLWASFWTGVAAAAKPNGIFIFLAILLYVAYYAIENVDGDYKKKLKKFIIDSTVYASIAIAAFLAFNLPIIYFVPLSEWWHGLINGMFHWDLMYKGPHPFESPIWNWFFNRNPFTIYFEPRIMIQTNWFLWDLAAVFSILFFLVPKIYPRREKRTGFALVNAAVWSIVLLYLAMYVSGGKTQFSYYSVQLTPFWVTIFTTILAYFIDWSRFKGTFFEEYIRPTFKGREENRSD